MKVVRTLSILAVTAACTLAADARAQDDSYSDQDPSALVDFNPSLNQHGTWVDDPQYGSLWLPNAYEVGPEFTPYVSGGHWVYGDDYTWVSDYDWGWVPFHYGRWVYVNDRGQWGWVPGREYAPAWVDWRVGDDYVGWAPSPPSYIWRGGLPVALSVPPPAPFVYCPHQELFSPMPVRAVIMGPAAVSFGMRTRPFYLAGPEVRIHRGPPPLTIGIAPARIVRFSGREPGVIRAQGFARPSSAVRFGAHPPSRGTDVSYARPGAPRPEGREPMREPGRVEPGREPPRGEPGREPGRVEPGREPPRGEPPRNEPYREPPRSEPPRGAPPRGNPPPQRSAPPPSRERRR